MRIEYYKKNVYGQAIGLLEESAKKMPTHPLVQYHLGMAYYKKGDSDRAREQLEKALNIQPDFPGSEQARQVLAEL